ncbi:MAG: hypothetical protein HN353_05225 [Bdellovibrionales bacterium]|nr:hypothetical protein [Bdellovibrionales bacterium]MBT3525020.1 hypothetical protein [Bdellovibrionales bacterium]MBT7767617.1 hypothetical protein [Bdellovibrionales bacterium]
MKVLSRLLLVVLLVAQVPAYASYWLEGVVVESESFRFCEVGNATAATTYPLVLRYYVDEGDGRFIAHDITTFGGGGWPTLYGYQVQRFSFGRIENSVEGELATNCSLFVDESFNMY